MTSARALLAHGLTAFLVAMACAHREVDPPDVNEPDPSAVFTESDTYDLDADGASASGDCDADTGLGCPSEIEDEATSATASVSYRLAPQSPPNAAADLELRFAGEAGSTVGATVDATVETTVSALEPDQIVLVRVLATPLGGALPFPVTIGATARVGADATPIPIDGAFHAVAVPQGIATVFVGVSIDASGAPIAPFDVVELVGIEYGGGGRCDDDTDCPEATPKCDTAQTLCVTGELGSDCGDDGDCLSGLCYQGTCGDGSPGSFCTVDRDCSRYCAAGYCQAGNENDYCNRPADCLADGAHCPLVFGDYGICTDGSQGDYCTDDGECIAPLHCDGSTCQS